MKKIQIDKKGIVYVGVQGRKLRNLTPEFKETIREILKSDIKLLLFDLSDLEYINSADLRVILKAVKEIQSQSGNVVLCCLKGYVKEVFEITCREGMITISDSVASGFRELSRKLNAA
jgi:anti-sigma B factor antagonist